MSETTPETSDLRERLAAALDEHRLDDNPAYGVLECECGEWNCEESHERHVADALLPVVAQEIAAAEQRGADRVAAAVEALADEWESWAKTRSTPRIDAFRDAAAGLRAALAEPAAKEHP